MPFREAVFDKIYCDPPHMLNPKSDEVIKRMIAVRRLRGRMSIDSFTRYAWWNSESEWLDFVRSTDLEFFRTLKPSAELRYKITDGKSKGTTKLSDLSLMKHFRIIRDQQSPSLPFKRNIVHYLTMSPNKSSLI